jgi:hypothetical protein
MSNSQKLHQLIKEDNFNKFSIKSIFDREVQFELMDEE